MYILRLEIKRHVSALYGHHQVFLFRLRFRYINCDVEISHPIIIIVYLCIGGYYITLIYIYILSLLVGGVSSWGCQLDVNHLFFRGLLSRGYPPTYLVRLQNGDDTP